VGWEASLRPGVGLVDPLGLVGLQEGLSSHSREGVSDRCHCQSVTILSSNEGAS
jgi:hypothetical protein